MLGIMEKKNWKATALEYFYDRPDGQCMWPLTYSHLWLWGANRQSSI